MNIDPREMSWTVERLCGKIMEKIFQCARINHMMYFYFCHININFCLPGSNWLGCEKNYSKKKMTTTATIFLFYSKEFRTGFSSTTIMFFNFTSTHHWLAKNILFLLHYYGYVCYLITTSFLFSLDFQLFFLFSIKRWIHVSSIYILFIIFHKKFFSSRSNFCLRLYDARLIFLLAF